MCIEFNNLNPPFHLLWFIVLNFVLLLMNLVHNHCSLSAVILFKLKYIGPSFGVRANIYMDFNIVLGQQM